MSSNNRMVLNASGSERRHCSEEQQLAFFSRSSALAENSSLSHVRRKVLSTPTFATMALSPSLSFLSFLSLGMVPICVDARLDCL